jgi:hypothetical protein
VDLPQREHDGRRLIVATVDLQPGQTRTLIVDAVSGPGQTRRPTLRVTPGAQPDDSIGAVSGSTC